MALRLDPEVVAWFRAHAPQYQPAMREVLRAYVREQETLPAAPESRINLECPPSRKPT